MKRYLFLVLFLFCTALAFAEAPYTHALFYSDFKYKFFKNLVNGQKTTFSICVAPDVTNELIKKNGRLIFLYALNEWLNNTQKFIHFSMQWSQFSDISKILQNIDNVYEIPCTYFDENSQNQTEADLTIVFKKNILKECHGLAKACYWDFKSAIFFSDQISTKAYYDAIMGTMTPYNRIMVHEMGHVFGLWDQYEGTSYSGSYIYNSYVKRPSVMEDGRNITCDDIDGFVTSIDRIRGKKRTFNSFCNDGLVIVNGKAQNFKKGTVQVYNEKFKYFDVETKVSYTNSSIKENTYYVDITAYNFNKNSDNAGIYYLRLMGFDVNDASSLSDTKVLIHAKVRERAHPTTYKNISEVYLKILGFVSSILMVNDKATQVITADARLEEEKYNRTIIGSGKKDELENIILPLINYYPIEKNTPDELNHFIDNFLKNAISKSDNCMDFEKEIKNNF